KAWRSRDLAVDNGQGTCNASYVQLPYYLNELVTANPGTVADLHTESNDQGGERFNENDMSWEWFFKKLSTFVTNESSLVVVSDRHPSIFKGVSKRNIRSNFKGSHLGYLVAKAARAYRLQDFYKTFNEIKLMDPACAAYLV
ncbi:unnamed protein product, partial [Brassica oleracea var. botrytis]